MSDPIEARVLVEIPLEKGGGRRVVARAADGGCHVFTLRGDDATTAEPDQSFTAASAKTLARAVLAGDETAMTAPATLRVLAAALVILRMNEDEGGEP